MPFGGVRLHVLIWVPLKLVGKGPIYWDLLSKRTVYCSRFVAVAVAHAPSGAASPTEAGSLG